MGNTHSQDRAIKTINKNISVNAGAGTGKTKVLTERFIYILENVLKWLIPRTCNQT